MYSFFGLNLDSTFVACVEKPGLIYGVWGWENVGEICHPANPKA